MLAGLSEGVFYKLGAYQPLYMETKEAPRVVLISAPEPHQFCLRPQVLHEAWVIFATSIGD